MSNSFYIILPSNCKCYASNKTNKFRVTLPHKIFFAGVWQAGLASIIFPVSWSAIEKNQFIDVVLKDGSKIKLDIPETSFITPQEIETGLMRGIRNKLQDELVKIQNEENDIINARNKRAIKPLPGENIKKNKKIQEETQNSLKTVQSSFVSEKIKPKILEAKNTTPTVTEKIFTNIKKQTENLPIIKDAIKAVINQNNKPENTLNEVIKTNTKIEKKLPTSSISDDKLKPQKEEKKILPSLPQTNIGKKVIKPNPKIKEKIKSDDEKIIHETAVKNNKKETIPPNLQIKKLPSNFVSQPPDTSNLIITKEKGKFIKHLQTREEIQLSWFKKNFFTQPS